MEASRLLRGARRGAGLSQRELARRAGVPQASLSRIERALVSPTVATLERLLKVCDMELLALPRPGEGVDTSLIEERLGMTPGQRARRAALEWNRMAPIRRARPAS